MILINRFMLNLRQLSDSEAVSAGHSAVVSTPIFRISVDVTGNMGESLSHGWSGTRDTGIDEPAVEGVAREDEGDELDKQERRQTSTAG